MVRVQADIKGQVSEDRCQQKVGQGTGTGRHKGTVSEDRCQQKAGHSQGTGRHKGTVSEDRCQQKLGQGTGRHKGTGFRRQVSTESSLLGRVQVSIGMAKADHEGSSVPRKTVRGCSGSDMKL